jgi:ribosomal protein L37E
MNHEFCMNCGHKAVFQVTKPKFCPSCGQPFNTSLASAKKAPQQEEEIEDRELDVDSIDIARLRKQISVESFGGKVTLDDLWSSPAPPDPTRRVAYAGADASNILKQIKAECSPVVQSREVAE